jgi:hypothetical protein
MYRTLDVPGEQVEVHMDIGRGRILRATLLIEENGAVGASSEDSDPFGEELDELLALTNSVSGFVDDSREAMYERDDGSI